jgi:hypothetical protein
VPIVDIRVHIRNTVDLEMDAYKREVADATMTVDPLVWWRSHKVKYPRLALTARVALAVPATSAPSERIFSFAGLLVSKKRAQLRGDNVQMLVFLRAMYQFRDRYPGIALPL